MPDIAPSAAAASSDTASADVSSLASSASAAPSSPSSAPSSQADAPEDPLPASYMVEGENYFDYQPGLECSAFSSAYLLRHYGKQADGLKLFEDYPSKIPGGLGVYPQGLVTFFTARGYTAELVTDATVEQLKRELVSTQAPVIVFIHVTEPVESVHNTHYVPVVGYDDEYLYFAESLDYMSNCKDEAGLAYNRKTDIAAFEKLWLNIDGVWDCPYFSVTPSQTDYPPRQARRVSQSAFSKNGRDSLSPVMIG